MTIDQRLKTNLLMVNSRRGAEVINKARHSYADDPDKKVDVDKPRFKSHVGWDNVSFQQGKHYDEENAGKHVRNQFCHAIKIVQIKNISCKKSEKTHCNTRFHWMGLRPSPLASVISMPAWLRLSSKNPNHCLLTTNHFLQLPPTNNQFLSSKF